MRHSHHGWAITGMCGLMLLLAGNVALADESGRDSWRFLVAPYLWIATIDGEVGAKASLRTFT